MSFDIKDYENYLLILDTSLDNLKNAKNSLIFDINLRNIGKIVKILSEKRLEKQINLFDIYIKKDIFNNMISFFSKKDIISKKVTCKNWHNMLNSYIKKNIPDLSNEPYKMFDLKCPEIKYIYAKRINNKICYYNPCSKNITIKNRKGKIVGKYNFGGVIGNIFGNSNMIFYYIKKTIRNVKGEIIIKLDSEIIHDITMDDKNIYVLAENEIFQYDIKGVQIKKLDIKSHSESNTSKILVDNDEIFIWGDLCKGVRKYSKKNGELIGVISNCSPCYKTNFDIYKNHIYLYDNSTNQIKVFSKNGKLIFGEGYKSNCTCNNLFVLNNELYILETKLYMYKIKFPPKYKN